MLRTNFIRKRLQIFFGIKEAVYPSKELVLQAHGAPEEGVGCVETTVPED